MWKSHGKHHVPSTGVNNDLVPEDLLYQDLTYSISLTVELLFSAASIVYDGDALPWVIGHHRPHYCANAHASGYGKTDRTPTNTDQGAGRGRDAVSSSEPGVPARWPELCTSRRDHS